MAWEAHWERAARRAETEPRWRDSGELQAAGDFSAVGVQVRRREVGPLTTEPDQGEREEEEEGWAVVVEEEWAERVRRRRWAGVRPAHIITKATAWT